MKCYLEIFVTSFEGDEHIRYSRMVIDISDDASNPDDIVQELVNPPLDNMPKLSGSRYISHSTSWRYEYDGSIYLTYMVYSDSVDFQRVSTKTLFFHEMTISQSEAPERPRPGVIKEEHIVSHGMRHLCHLIMSSPAHMFDGVLSPRSRSLFHRMHPILAGKVS
jgi:hypothetical protein